MSMSHFCRLCLKSHAMTTKACSSEFLLDVFPGMNVYLTNSIRLCETCFSNLNFSKLLKQSFLKGKRAFLNGKNSSRYCNLCFKLENNSFLMFHPHSESILKEMIRIVLSLNTDDINPNICGVCWSWMKVIHSFKRDCLKMEKSLQAYCVEKQLNKLSDNDIKAFVSGQVYRSDACFHQEYFKKYSQVYPNINYDNLHKNNLNEQKKVKGAYGIQENIGEHSENLEVSDKNYSGGQLCEQDNENIKPIIDDDCMVVADYTNFDPHEIIDYNNSNSVIVIEDEETRSATVESDTSFHPDKIAEFRYNDATIIIEDEETCTAIIENNTNFDPKKIVGHNINNSTIVIEDEETRPAIMEDFTNFAPTKIEEYNQSDSTVVIEDEEARSAIVEYNTNFNSKIVACDNNYSTIVIEDEETRSMIVEDNITNFDQNFFLKYTNNVSTVVIEDEETRSAMVEDNTNFNPEIAEFNNNYSTIVIEDEESGSMIVEDNTNFDPKKVVKYNKNDSAITVIEDNETHSMIVEDDATLNAKKVVERNKNYFRNVIDASEFPSTPAKIIEFCVYKNTGSTTEDDSGDLIINEMPDFDTASDSLVVDEDSKEKNYLPTQNMFDDDCYEDKTSGNEDLLVTDNDCYEIGTGSELTAELTFVESKYNIEATQVTQLQANRERSATNLTIWGCYVCAQVFFEKLKMRKHLMDHEIPGNKYGRFKCKRCPFSANYLNSLTRHMRIHSRIFRMKFSGIKENYFCQYCDDIFGEKGDIVLHMSEHLITWKKFLCTGCSISTKSSVKLRAHYRKKHGKKAKRNF